MRLIERLLPPKLWVKMTIVNIALLIGVVIVTGMTLYQTACFLAADLTGVEREAQLTFNNSLLIYAWVIGGVVIVMGAFLYSTVTRKVLVPVKELTSAMETMKTGTYPENLNVHTHDEIGELVDHFNRMNRRLQQQERSRHQMLRDLSHELRTPLSNLQGYLEALEKGVIEGDQAIYCSLAEETDRVSQLLSRLDDMESWRMVAPTKPLEVSQEEMTQVISQVRQMFNLEFEKKGIGLKSEIEAAEVPINRQGFQQVLTNLLRNALDYHEGTDGVKVVGRTEGKSYVIEVKGEGRAIPVDEKDRVFDRFYRVDPSRSDGRSGLGLSISKQIVERHDGQIQLETDGRKHCFSITLPMQA
ncbi:HAMP domain-containing sensor histidine kinase [Halobacillus litoralis]|uniref:HAMP domain-containing sensor histidine kinase n=1 Tax=Halobacillus litoralis TaxID=45668 RepID=UPI001CFF0C78|nr:HAMP domain-containing sensor histidine kinase [Halobacillus litoralis]WLR48049.1 HAMP domain-containing sensor histidine kinase [Halobacillus litoralis]